MHFKGKDPVKERFTTINPYTRKQMVFLLDPSVSSIVIFCIPYWFSNVFSKATITVLIINSNKLLLTSLSLIVIFIYIISIT